MHNSLSLAKKKLLDGNYTCVVLTEDDEYVSCERGVKPLLILIDSKKSYRGAFAADKTVGAGAAHLYVLLGIRSLFANIISESAIKILQDNGIEVFYNRCVPYIINRRGDGICPIENAVTDAKSSPEAYDLIIETLNSLNK